MTGGIVNFKIAPLFVFKKMALSILLFIITILFFQNCGSSKISAAKSIEAVLNEPPVTYKDPELPDPKKLDPVPPSPHFPNHAPIITEQPLNKSVYEGEEVELRVSTQAPYANVQWYRDSQPIPNATSGVLKFIATSANKGFYAAIVYYDSNRLTTSNGAMVTVKLKSAPLITFQPSDQSYPAGGSITLFAGYTGNPFPSIQWMKDGAAISGANSPSLIVSSSGNYSFFIYNEIGIANSYTTKVHQEPTTPPPASTSISALAFSYSKDGEVRVGWADLSGGNANVYTYTGHQQSAAIINSSQRAFSKNGSRCGVILKPNLSFESFLGTYTLNINTITLQFGGHSIVFARTLNAKNLRLISINGNANAKGFGYAGNSTLKRKTRMLANIGNKIYSTNEFWHKRGAEDWWLPNNGQLGIYPQKYQSSDNNASGQILTGSDNSDIFDSMAFNEDPTNYGVVYRHFGHDFYHSNCNTPNMGHTHFMLSYGENDSIEGFMIVELSYNLTGNYISVGRLDKIN